MLLASLSQLYGLFSRRFFFNALLPTLIFTSATVLVGGYSFGLVADWQSVWSRADALSKLTVIAVYLASIWFLSSAVGTQWRNIVRLFEGYPLLTLLGHRAPGVAWHSRQQRLLWEGDAELGIEPDAHVLYRRYPLPSDDDIILPTRLGNVLLAAERYSLSRYGMDMIYFWTRLFPLLPESFKKDMDEFLLDYEFPLVVAFEAAMAGVVGSAFLLIGRQSPSFFAAWLISSTLLAYGFYVLGIGNAEELGEQQRVAFDLYRHLLLEAWPTPLDVRDEREAFTEIQEFIVSNFEPGWGVAQRQHRRRAGGDHSSS
jgi:hypothetical protein